MSTNPPPDRLDAARVALAHGDVILAYDAAAAAVVEHPDDLDAQYLVALSLVRAGARGRARDALTRLRSAIAAAPDASLALREDAEALEGRLAKDLALANHGVERTRLAAVAAQIYEAVANRYDRYYTCVNAATLWLVAGDRERAEVLASKALRLVHSRAPLDTEDDAYWRAATDAEARLVLGDVDGAAKSLAEAAVLDAADVAARAITARQLRLVCEVRGTDASFLDVLRLPSVMHYCGHRATADGRETGGFRHADAPLVSAEIAAFLDRHSVDAAFGSLACGADILVAESLIQRGVGLHVLLPFGIDEFEAVSVRPGGSEWVGRYRSCLDRATSVLIAYDSAYENDASLFGYAAQLAMGFALNRARNLGIDARQLAIWDGRGEDAKAGTGHDVATWRATGHPTHVIPVVHQRAPREREAAYRQDPRRRIGAMLFADVRGFSRLHDEHQAAFVDAVLRPCGEALDAFGTSVEYRNTWGDAILAVFSSVATAAAAALDFQRIMSSLDLASNGLPLDLGMRVGAHVGPLLELDDPVRRVPTFWGRELTRTARIEPRTPEGEVYVTEAFASMCALESGDKFACEYVGRVETAKQFETIPMYRLRRS